MVRYLHTLSAILFYILGSSMFVAYVLYVNDIAKVQTGTWLETSDLPLLFMGLLYGGLSVYRSLTNDKKESTVLALSLGIPLLAIFLVFVSLKFFVHLS